MAATSGIWQRINTDWSTRYYCGDIDNDNSTRYYCRKIINDCCTKISTVAVTWLPSSLTLPDRHEANSFVSSLIGEIHFKACSSGWTCNPRIVVKFCTSQWISILKVFINLQIHLIASSFRGSLFIECAEGAEDLRKRSGSFEIIRWWPISWFLYQ